MQQRNAVRVVRGFGGLVAALAVVPWLGSGTAMASPSTDNDCSTRPNGVLATAVCAQLGSAGGEVWAARSSANELKVKVYPTVPGTVTLCVTKSGAFAAGYVCSAEAISTGSLTTINYPLGASFIKATDAAWFAVSVTQGDTITTALGQAPATPTPSPSATATPTPTPTTGSPSPSATATTGSPSPSATESTGSPSPSVSATETTNSPSPSVSATESTNSPTPSISVLPTKIQGSTDPAVQGLAHTGSGGEMNTLLVSLALLGVGGALIAGTKTRRETARRH